MNVWSEDEVFEAETVAMGHKLANSAPDTAVFSVALLVLIIFAVVMVFIAHRY